MSRELFKISVSSNVKQLTKQLSALAEKQVRFAASQAINDVVQDCRKTVPDKMRRVFREPVPRTLNSLRYTKANKNSLTASLWIEDFGGKGIAPARYLSAEIEGGTRNQKRFERALQMRGLMPAGMFAVPADNVPRDASGNVPGSFYVRLLSYLSAFGEQGYRANMTAKQRARMARLKVSARGYKTITGVVYFVSLGHGKTAHLPPGIYRKSGTHGAVIEPVFAFVTHATYTRRLDFVGTVQKTVSDNFDSHMEQRLKRALETAR